MGGLSQAAADRKLRQLAIETALSCPCCGALLHLFNHRDVPDDVQLIFSRMLKDRHFKLGTIEDAEEHVRTESASPRRP